MQRSASMRVNPVRRANQSGTAAASASSAAHSALRTL
jgi:hypothetical protein